MCAALHPTMGARMLLRNERAALAGAALDSSSCLDVENIEPETASCNRNPVTAREGQGPCSLSVEWCATRSPRALDELVRAYQPLVLALVRQARARHVPRDDLVSAGNEGLVRAAHKFDVTRGFRFATLAQFYVREAIQECARRDPPDGILRPKRKGGAKCQSPVKRRRPNAQERAAAARYRAEFNGRLDSWQRVVVDTNAEDPDAPKARIHRDYRDKPEFLGPIVDGKTSGDAPPPLVDEIVIDAMDRVTKSRLIDRALESLDPVARRILQDRLAVPGQPVAWTKIAAGFDCSGETLRKQGPAAIEKFRGAVLAIVRDPVAAGLVDSASDAEPMREGAEAASRLKPSAAHG